MHSFISIDVGIKNLAYCLFVKNTSEETDSNTNSHAKATYKIQKWDSVNLTKYNATPETNMKCCHVDKHNVPCNKPAKFSKNTKCYCKIHSKKQTFLIPTAELKPSFINKQKIQALFELADKYNIQYQKPMKKADLISVMNEYIYNHCFEPVIVSNTNASKIDLITIGRNIQKIFDERFGSIIATLDGVIIENQVSPIANRMKCIQCIVMQYFIMKKPDIRIEFISASNKLKKSCSTIVEDSDKESENKESENKESENKESKEKTEYSERKKMGIQKCIELLNVVPSEAELWKPFFTSHAKKDDLADSYLQGIWYMEKHLCK